MSWGRTTSPIRVASAAWRATDVIVPAGVLGVAALGWWWSVRMAHADMATAGVLSLVSFWAAWVAMMAAMMFPAIAPVVRLYARAAARCNVAPVPCFVAGYLLIWSALGLPTFFVWRSLMMPLSDGASWAGRLAGAALVAAALYQLTPLKAMCLRHCRSPLSFFMRYGRHLEQPMSALRMGLAHGSFCLGCCWSLMAVLIALGTMQPWWMMGLAVLIFGEKNLRWGWRVSQLAAVAFAGMGLVLLMHPATITQLV